MRPLAPTRRCAPDAGTILRFSSGVMHHFSSTDVTASCLGVQVLAFEVIATMPVSPFSSLKYAVTFVVAPVQSVSSYISFPSCTSEPTFEIDGHLHDFCMQAVWNITHHLYQTWCLPSPPSHPLLSLPAVLPFIKILPISFFAWAYSSLNHRMQYRSWFEDPTLSSTAFDVDSHILCHTMNRTRLQAAPIVLLQSTTNILPRPARSHATNSSATCSFQMSSSQVWINNSAFSKYECEIACAIQLYIRNANNRVPTDETLGFIIKALRGDVNGVPLPCQNMVYIIEHYDTEAVRAIYLSVRKSVPIL